MKIRDLTSGSINKGIFSVAIPTFLNMLLLFSYNIIDMYFVSRLGTIAVASIGNAMLFLNFGYGLNFLGVTGIGIKVSHAIGRDDKEDLYKYIGVGLVINLIIAIFTILVINIFAYDLISLITIETEELRRMTYQYLVIFSYVLGFSFFNTFYTRILASMGKSDIALRINSVGVILNIILDPILIFTLDLGIRGAVYASLISNILNFILHTYYSREDLKIAISKVPEKIFFKEGIRLGLPYTLQRILFTAVGFVTGRAVSNFGAEAMAGHKLAFQIESFTLIGLGSLITAMSVFAGQNLGAKEYDRIREGYKKTISVGLLYSLFTSVIFIFLGREILGLFVKDELAIHYGYLYLKLICIGQFFAALEMIGNGLYTGIGIPKVPTIISVTITPIRVFFVPFFVPIFGIQAVFYGLVITSIVKGSISYGYYQLKVKNKIGTTIIAIDD